MEVGNLKDQSLKSQIEHYRAKLFPFAYDILGDLMEAEDIVQETLNGYFLATNAHIAKPFSYLVKSVINQSINQKKLLRRRKEVYPGEWLPVPVVTEEGIYSKADKKHILNYSLLVLLEKLNPRERAVFILKESFDFRHHEIADVLEMPVANSRQLLKRAKQKLEPQSHKSFDLKHKDQQVLEQLVTAITETDMEKVKDLLSAEISATSDGGGKVAAARNILTGGDRVSKFMKAIWHKYKVSAQTKFVQVNHQPAFLFLYNERIVGCMIFEMAGMKVAKVYIIVNPDKLRSLNFQS